MRIFIAGGTGFVGGHVQRILISRGHSIRLLVHRRASAEPGVEQCEGDVMEPATFSDALVGCDATINLVGIIREFPSRDITYHRLLVQATGNVLEVARAAGVKRHLQMSALGAGPDAATGYFQGKYEGEVEVRESGLDYTIFRPSIIFGPKDGFVNQLARYLRVSPAMPVIGDGEYQLQPIAARDVARCFAEALELPETVGQTYDLCGPDRMSYNELLDAVGRALGRKSVLKVNVPVAVLQRVVPFLESYPAFPLTMDQMTMLLQGSACNGTWRRTFTFTPTRFEEGIRSYLKP